MKVQNLKELQKIIQLCRKSGVTTISIDGISLTLGAAPRPIVPNRAMDYAQDFPEANIKVPQFQGYQTPIIESALDLAKEELTGDQLLYYSSVPHEQGEHQ